MFTVFSYFNHVLFNLNKLYLLYIFCNNNLTDFKILINDTKFSCAAHLSQYEKLQNKGIYNTIHNYINTLLYMMNVVKYLISNVVSIMFLQQFHVEAMGNSPSPEVLPQEWRNVPWGKQAEELQFVNDYKPSKDNIKLRFMLYGPVGAGKSSFINSVESVLRGEITGRAKTGAISGAMGVKSITRSYKAYKILKKGSSKHYPFVFNDIMGLEKDEGVCVEDIKLAMKGHVKDGYEFNPRSFLSENDQHYKKKPTVKDRVHVLVCIIPGSMARMQDDSVRKLKEVRLAAMEMDIPEIAIVTKIEEACPEVGKDIRNVYKSKYLKNKIEEVSGELGFPPSCIFPVKNYHSELQTSDDTDTLILSALRRMIQSGEDFVKDL